MVEKLSILIILAELRVPVVSAGNLILGKTFLPTWCNTEERTKSKRVKLITVQAKADKHILHDG